MFYAGLDVHTRYVVLVLINKQGERVLARRASGLISRSGCSRPSRRIGRSRR